MRLKALYIVCVAIFVQDVGSSQQPRVATVVTKSSRPLMELAQALCLKEQWLVDYEDPAYILAGDLVDVTNTQTSQAFRAANPGKRIWGVRSKPVTFSFPFRTASPTLENPAAFVSTLLAVNQQAGNPGTFKVISRGRHLQIVPDKANNVLDQPINFPNAVRSGSEIVYLVRDQLRNSGVNIGIGTIPTNYLNQTQMTIGANNEPVRDVLIKMINGLNWRDANIHVPTSQLVWRLLYAPDLEKPSFMINLEIARAEVDAPGGGQVTIALH